MEPEYLALLRGEYDRYLKCLSNEDLEPKTELLTYNFDFLKGRKWYALGEWMIDGDLQELTNLLNGWSQLLERWHAWNKVLITHNDDTVWDLRSEFVESLVHECLLKPSSIRDVFTSVATNAFHQVRLSADQAYKDYLVGDPSAENPKPAHLSKNKKEKRLAQLASYWPESGTFMQAHAQINNNNYILATYDYRNLISHTIGPRIGVGYTRMVTRSVSPAYKFEYQLNSTINEVPLLGKMSVSYGFGGTPPLDLEKVRIANLEQFKLAHICYLEYRQLLESVVSKISPIKATNTE